MAEKTTSGLDAVSEDSADTTTPGGLQGTTSINIGGQKISTKGGIQGQALLDAMQEEYARRVPESGLGRFNTFLEGMKDAVAITSRDPGSAMAARDQEKRLNQESLFQMRANMAALKGQMAEDQRMQGEFFGKPGAQGAAPAPAAGGVTPSVVTATNGLINAVEDPALKQQIATQFSIDRNVAMKQLNAYLAERAKKPEVQREVEYLTSAGLDPKRALDVALLKVAGSGAFVPHDVRTAAGTVQSTPLSTASGVNRVAPAPAAPAAGAPGAAPAAPAVAATPAAPAAVARPAAPAPAPAAPAAVARPAAPAPAAPAPAATSNVDLAGLSPTSSEALELRKKAAESHINVSQKEGETAAGEAGKSQAQMNKLAAAANETMPAARAVLDIVEDPRRRHVAGYLHGNNPTATALYTVAQHTSNKMPDQLEKEFIENRLSGPELVDYQTLGNSAQKLGIGYAADVFKGARMGIGLEKMAMGAKGVGPELMPEVNAKNARLIHDAAQFQLDKQAMWGEWSKNHGGNTASFDEFERSPQYVQFRDKARDHFINTYRGLVVPDAATSPADRARAELERRRATRGAQ
jgi:hypothetical protein